MSNKNARSGLRLIVAFIVLLSLACFGKKQSPFDNEPELRNNPYDSQNGMRPEIESFTVSGQSSDRMRIAVKFNEPCLATINYRLADLSGPIETIASGAASTDVSFELVGLLAGQNYHLELTGTDLQANQVPVLYDSAATIFLERLAYERQVVGQYAAYLRWQSNVPVCYRLELFDTTGNLVQSRVDSTLGSDFDIALSGLRMGHDYRVRVQLEDASRNSLSFEDSFTTKAVTITDMVTEALTTNQISLAWRSDIRTQTIVWCTGLSVAKQVRDYDSSFSTDHRVDIAELADKTSYKMEISHIDQNGDSSYVSGYIFTTGSFEVSSEKIVAVDPTTANVSWRSNAPFRSAVILDGYDTTKLGGFHTEHSITLESLVPGRTYGVQIYLADDAGNNYLKEMADFTAPAFEITQVQVANIEHGRAQVSWQTNLPATGQLTYSSAHTAAPIVVDMATSSSYQEVQLEQLYAGEEYQFNILARYGADIAATYELGYWQTISYELYGEQVSNPESEAVRVSWQVQAEVECKVQYGQGDYGLSSPWLEANSVHKYDITGLNHNQEYQYRVLGRSSASGAVEYGPSGSFTTADISFSSFADLLDNSDGTKVVLTWRSSAPVLPVTVRWGESSIAENTTELTGLEYGYQHEIELLAGLLNGRNYIYSVELVDHLGAQYDTGLQGFNTINQPPQVSLFATTAYLHEDLRFYTSSNDPDGRIIAYLWDTNGDGEYDTTTVAGEVYIRFAVPGAYTITVQAADSGGGVDQDSVEVGAYYRRLVVTDLEVTEKSNIGAKLSWQTPEPASAKLYWWTSMQGGKYSVELGNGATEFAYTIANLQSTVSCFYLVEAWSDNGAQHYATELFSFTTEQLQLEFAPPVLAYDNLGRTLTSLAWSSDYPIVSKQIVIYQVGQESPLMQLVVPGASFSRFGQVSVLGLAVGASYRYQLIAEESPGKAFYTDLQDMELLDAPPHAVINLDLISNPRALADLTFTAQGSSDDIAINEYLWDLDGDGSYEYRRGDPGAVTTFFAGPGRYQLGLAVKDGAGNLDTSTVVLNIGPRAGLNDTDQTIFYDQFGQVLDNPSGHYLAQDAGAVFAQPLYYKLDAAGNKLSIDEPFWAATGEEYSGLIWEHKKGLESDPSYALAQVAYSEVAAQLLAVLAERELAGLVGWRLPQAGELLDLASFQPPDDRSWQPDFFPFQQNGSYWSGDPGTLVGAELFYRTVDPLAISLQSDLDDLTSNYVQAVTLRDLPPQLGDRFDHDLVSDLIYDSSTGLTWELLAEGDAKLSWVAALEHCQSLNRGGFVDWRLPNIKELLSLYSYSASKRSFPSGYFADTPESGNVFWSSTTDHDWPSDAFVLNYDSSLRASGALSRQDKGQVAYARAVRYASPQVRIESDDLTGISSGRLEIVGLPTPISFRGVVFGGDGGYSYTWRMAGPGGDRPGDSTSILYGGLDTASFFTTAGHYQLQLFVQDSSGSRGGGKLLIEVYNSSEQ